MTDQPKWTPGPWSRHFKTGTVKGPEGNTVADCRYKNGRNDANLIAAAPEMYEALAALIDEIDDCAQPSDWDAYVPARAALAKARGDT